MGRQNDRLFTLRAGGLVFAPALLSTIAVLILLPVMVHLGFWQLDRAAEKRAILTAYEQRAEQLPVALDGRINDATALEFRRATARGQYDAAHSFLVDNRVQGGVAGFDVLTPLVLRDESVAVLVNRGWIPLGPSRTHLPDIPAPAGGIAVAGTVSLPSAPVFDLPPEAAYSSGWPKIVMHVNTEDFENMLHYPLLPLVLRLDPDERDGFVRKWKPVTMYPEKHTSYAFQWFGLSAALAIIYLLVNTTREQPNRSEQNHDA